MNISDVSEQAAEQLFNQLNEQAESGGYHLNSDKVETLELLKGLIVNRERYGYMACPCRVASGTRQDDLDIICPCDYRDPDLTEYGYCFCGLYVTGKVIREKRPVEPIPERRPENPGSTKAEEKVQERTSLKHGKYPVWRCKVCGYLCARDHPPHTCPVCKADRDRFEKF